MRLGRGKFCNAVKRRGGLDESYTVEMKRVDLRNILEVELTGIIDY